MVPRRAGADPRYAHRLAAVLDKIGTASRGPQGIGRGRGRARHQSDAAGGDFQPPSPQSAATLDGDRRAVAAAGPIVNRLRNKLIVIFLVATLAPLGVTV